MKRKEVKRGGGLRGGRRKKEGERERGGYWPMILVGAELTVVASTALLSPNDSKLQISLGGDKNMER